MYWLLNTQPVDNTTILVHQYSQRDPQLYHDSVCTHHSLFSAAELPTATGLEHTILIPSHPELSTTLPFVSALKS